MSNLSQNIYNSYFHLHLFPHRVCQLAQTYKSFMLDISNPGTTSILERDTVFSMTWVFLHLSLDIFNIFFFFTDLQVLFIYLFIFPVYLFHFALLGEVKSGEKVDCFPIAAFIFIFFSLPFSYFPTSLSLLPNCL